MKTAAELTERRKAIIARGIDSNILALVKLARPEADVRETNRIHCAVLDALAGLSALEQAEAGEPVAWQSRARQSMEGGHGPWSEWRDGKAPQPIPFYYEVEERPLYTRPTAPQGEAVSCAACEGKPVFPNDPCAVCGEAGSQAPVSGERELDVEATAENIARHLSSSQKDGGENRYHGPTYGAAKAGAEMGIRAALATPVSEPAQPTWITMGDALRSGLKAHPDGPLVPAVRQGAKVFSNEDGHDMALDAACRAGVDTEAIDFSPEEAFGYVLRSEPAQPSGVAVENGDLPFVVQYRRKDDGIRWVNMAAFDTEGPALRYYQNCSGETTPWEYRVVALTQPVETAATDYLRGKVGEIIVMELCPDETEDAFVQSSTFRHAVEKIVALIPPSPAPVGTDAMVEYGKHLNWELDWGSIYTSDNPNECAWRVHKRSGGRNDREWTLLGSGETPLAALEAALSSTERGGA